MQQSGNSSSLKRNDLKKNKRKSGLKVVGTTNTGRAKSDFPVGVNHVYPNGITLCVTDLSSCYTEHNTIAHGIPVKDFLNVSVEDVTLDKYESMVKSPRDTIRSCKNSVSFLKALLSTTGETPNHELTTTSSFTPKSSFDFVVRRSASLPESGGAVFDISDDHHRSSTDLKRMKRHKTSLVPHLDKVSGADKPL
ncbi:hypothetical protein Btru_076753 [Bulinus truncatus]|nr:hypothetical protein Btru_076753 [Bulinus truncatus]